MFLSVIIPAYNEENRLGKTLRKVHEYLSKQSYDYEILVVNAASDDTTREVAEHAMQSVKNLRILNLPVSYGKGHAVKEGMRNSSGQFRIFMDADNATSIDHAAEMIPYFQQGYDVVIGSRDVKGAKISVPQPWFRRILGDIFNIIVQVLGGLWGIFDTQCGFKGFSTKAVENIFPRITIFGWAFDVEVLVLAKKLGYKIKEVPVTWINDPESKVRLRGMIKMLLEVVKIRWNMIRNKYKG